MAAPAPRYPRVQITPEIIETSCRADSSNCMIADAIKQQIPDALHVSVDLQTIRYTRRGTGRRYICLTPTKGQLAIIEFDQGREVEPFALNLVPMQIVKANLPTATKGKSPQTRKAKPSDQPEAERRRGALLEGETVPMDAEPTRTKQLAMPSSNAGVIPVIVGGYPPKTMDKAAHAKGRRRKYGLRSLEQ